MKIAANVVEDCYRTPSGSDVSALRLAQVSGYWKAMVQSAIEHVASNIEALFSTSVHLFEKSLEEHGFEGIFICGMLGVHRAMLEDRFAFLQSEVRSCRPALASADGHTS